MKCSWGLLLILLSSTTFFAQSKLQYNLKVGDIYLVKQNVHQLTIQKMGETSHELSNTVDGILKFEVLSVSKESYQVSLSFEDLRMKMTSNLQGNLIDVNAKDLNETDAQSKIFHSILNYPVTIKLAKTGNIIAVKGGEKLIERMIAASDIEDEFTVAIMKASLEEEFGSEALTNNYKQMTYFYPDTTNIGIGDSWENSYTGKFETQNKWTLAAQEKEEYIISGSSTLLIEVVDEHTSMNLAGSQTTMIQADDATGFVKRMNVIGHAEGNSTIKQWGNQQIPTTLKTTITYQLIQE